MSRGGWSGPRSSDLHVDPGGLDLGLITAHDAAESRAWRPGPLVKTPDPLLDARVPTHPSARLLVCAAATLFSTGGAAIKLASMTGWQVASFRSGIAALAVLVLLAEARRAWTWRTLLVAVGYAGTLILFVQSTKLTTAANAIFLQATAPLYLAVLGPWLLHEPLRRRDLWFMAALVAGLGLFFIGAEPPRTTAPAPMTGNLLAVASGMCWASTVLGLRWMETQADRGQGSGAAAVVAGNVLAFVVGLPFAWPVAWVSAGDALIIVYLGVVQIALAYAFLTRAMRHVPALEAALLLSIEPVLNPVWAWLVHGEVPSMFAILGGGIILVATILHSRSR